MSETAVAPALPFKNRQTGLILFGIALIGFGVLSGVMALLSASTLFIPRPPRAGAMPPARMIIGIVPFYLACSGFLIVLGIGSIRSRRWARSLILATSWIWLLFGALGMIAMVGMSRWMFAALPPDQAAMWPIMIGCMSAFMVIFGVVVPLLFVLFYRGRNVQATVESLDPQPRWTDRIPLRVLIFSCVMFLGASSVVMCSFIYNALPIGPWMLGGFGATAILLAFGAISLFIAIGSLKLQRSAWWTALGMFTFGAVYSAIFATRTNWEAWYHAMGMPTDPRQMEMLRAIYSGPLFYVWLSVLWAAYFAFLFYIRRDFFRTSTG